MKKQKIPVPVVIAGIFSLTAIELFALYKGIDGVLLSTVIGIIALAIGVAVPNPFRLK